MGYIHNGMQGKIGEVKDKKGIIWDIDIYQNSSNFPTSNMIELIPKDKDLNKIERVPLNEELWQKTGECLGYKFKRFKDKDVQ